MPQPVGPYSPTKRAGHWIAVSGQVGIRDGALVPGGFTAELAQVLANLKSVIEAAGGRLDQVVKTTVLLVDMDDYAEMNEAYMSFFADHRPARRRSP